MINYTPANQLKFEDFSTPFERGLNKENRWVKLAEVTPWDELAQIYASKLNSTKGKKSIDIRTILGALILKHKTRTSDREVLEMIVESPYLQFFCGYRSFSHRKPFDASLFVAIRERMGIEEFKGFNRILIAKAQEFKGSTTRKRSKQKKSNEDDTGDGGEVTHKGTLKLDATVCDQQIKYPTDLGLLNEARKKSEDFIDILYGPSALEQKPRTYRQEAAEAYMAIAKMKQKSIKVIRNGIKQQLQYLRRNLGYLDHMLLFYDETDNPLSKKQYRQLLVISEIYRQQQYMYDNETNSIADRIVSIYQPWVRPIVRGKAKFKTEFGAKINVSEIDGFAVINQFCWDAYNEATYMKDQVEQYKEQFGFYPELVLADRIYMNRENRAWLKEHDIRHGGVPLGRKPKEEKTSRQKRKEQKERNQRNHIEGKFGQAKRRYGLNQVAAKVKETSESWVSCIFFVMNLLKLAKMASKNVLKWLFKLITGNLRATESTKTVLMRTRRHLTPNLIRIS